MRIKACCLVLLFCVVHLANASNMEWQRGYIIQNNDTLRGELAFRDGDGDWKTCLFKTEVKAAVQTFSPEQIKAYGYASGLNYVSKQVELYKIQGLFFVQALLLGNMNLYYLNIDACAAYPQGYAAYIVEKPDGSMIEMLEPQRSDKRTIVQRQNRTKLNMLFSEYPELKAEIKAVDSGRDNWIVLFKKYHDLICKDYTCTFYQEGKSARRWSITPYLGATYANIPILNFESFGSWYPDLGVLASYNLSKFSKRYLLNIGLDFSGAKLKKDRALDFSYYDRNKVFHERYGGIDLNLSRLTNFLSVEYRFMSKTVQPFIEVGFFHSIQFAMNNQLKANRDLRLKDDFHLTTYQCGILGGVGVNFDLKKHQIPVRLQYRWPFGINGKLKDNQLAIGWISMFTMSVGWTFGLGK